VIAYYKENIQLYFMFFAWVIVGIYGGPLIYAVLPLSILLMVQKGQYEELFIGYFFILILSDNLDESLLFAKDIKNVYAGLMALLFLFNINEFSPLDRLYKLFMPFFIFSVFTMLFSVVDPFFFTSIQKTISYFLSFLIVPNFVIKLYRENGTDFFKRLIFFCVTVLILGLLLKFIAHNFVYLPSGRYRGVLGNPNGLGIFTFLLFIIFFMINNFFPKLFSKTERLLIFAVIIISIVMTGSRNGILAVLLFYFFQRFYRGSPFIGFLLFLVTLAIIEVISTHLTEIIIELGLGDFFRINTLEDGSGRYIAWDFAWKQIQKNFFIGKGFAYNEYYMRQYYGLLSKLGHQGGIHNSFLTFWMDQGLIGLLIYLRSYILMFVNAAKKTKFAYPILFAISFTAIFESWLVGSLSAYAFMAMIIFTIMSNDEIVVSQEIKTDEEVEGQLNQTPLVNDY
jgi:O-antigen ligase